MKVAIEAQEGKQVPKLLYCCKCTQSFYGGLFLWRWQDKAMKEDRGPGTSLATTGCQGGRQSFAAGTQGPQPGMVPQSAWLQTCPTLCKLYGH